MNEPAFVEGPAPGVTKPLCFRQVERGLFAVFDVQVHPKPAQETSTFGSDGFGATEEPAIRSVDAANPKRHLTSASSPQAVRPDSSRLVVVVWMQERDVGIPRGACFEPETKGVIARETEVVSASCIHEGETTHWRRVPRVS